MITEEEWSERKNSRDKKVEEGTGKDLFKERGKERRKKMRQEQKKE